MLCAALKSPFFNVLVNVTLIVYSYETFFIKMLCLLPLERTVAIPGIYMIVVNCDIKLSECYLLPVGLCLGVL